MADQNTRVTRERIGTTIDQDITGLESSEERGRVGSFAGTDPAEPRRHAATPKGAPASTASDARTRDIRAEIEQTRDDLSETVNAIQDRLQPATLAANAAEGVKDAAREHLRDIADTDTVRYVRANPMPTAMIGIGLAGLAWLVFGRDGDSRSRGGHGQRDWRTRSSSDFEGDYRLRSRETDSVSAGARAAAAGAGHDLVEQTRQSAQRAQGALRQVWDESPFLIGAAAAVIGALVAATVPATDSENRLMGETRERMVEGVQTAVKDKVQAVETAATNAVSQVQKAVGLESSE